MAVITCSGPLTGQLYMILCQSMKTKDNEHQLGALYYLYAFIRNATSICGGPLLNPSIAAMALACILAVL